MHRKVAGGSRNIAVTGIPHIAQMGACKDCLPNFKLLRILRQMRIIKIGSGRTADADAVPAEAKPSHIFHDSVGYAVYGIDASLVHRSHNITAFMSPLTAKVPALHPAVCKAHSRIPIGGHRPDRKTFQIVPHGRKIAADPRICLRLIPFCIQSLYGQLPGIGDASILRKIDGKQFFFRHSFFFCLLLHPGKQFPAHPVFPETVKRRLIGKAVYLSGSLQNPCV